MVIYNVSVKVNPEIQEDWLHWMRTHHIPKVLATGSFLMCRLSHLDLQEEDGITYIIQYEAISKEALNNYMIRYSPALQKEHIDRYSNRFVAFRTVLDVIEDIFPLGRKT